MSNYKTEKKSRNITIDILKAIAIILVVFGHSMEYCSGSDYYSKSLYFDNTIFKIIYSFHMPLFMLISGYLFSFSVKKGTFTYNIKKKIRTILIPIIAWGCLALLKATVSMIFKHKDISVVILFENFINIIFTSRWFLWAVLWCSLFVIIARYLFKDNMIVYLIGLIITFLVPDVLNSELYKFMFPFFVIGYFYNEKNLKIKLNKYIESPFTIIIFFFIYLLLMQFYNYDSYIYTSKYCLFRPNVDNPLCQLGIDFYRFTVGLVGSMIVILLISMITKYVSKESKIIRAMSFIGKNTLGIYIIQAFVISILERYTANLNGLNYIYTIMETILVVSVSLGATYCIQRIKILNVILLGGR